MTQREFKFRAWDGEKIVHPDYVDRKGTAWWKENGISTSSTALMLFTGIKDKNKVDVYEGDIVIGIRSRMSDGYLKIGYPSHIRCLLEVKWSDGKHYDAGFYLDERKVHDEDKFAADQYRYRDIKYNLRESRAFELVDNKIQWLGYNEDIEIIGNIYENPELIATQKI